MKQFQVNAIGHIVNENDTMYIQLNEDYKDALIGLNDFSYVQVIWWFDGCDNDKNRSNLIEHQPYKEGPEQLGIFATRSPSRPNPIAVSTSYVTFLDQEHGILGLAYIDANNNSPILDIKPYTPSLDRVEHPSVPSWCNHWPKNVETSGDFDWEKVFNF